MWDIRGYEIGIERGFGALYPMDDGNKGYSLGETGGFEMMIE
jgi:hypothetical protein